MNRIKEYDYINRIIRFVEVVAFLIISIVVIKNGSITTHAMNAVTVTDANNTTQTTVNTTQQQTTIDPAAPANTENIVMLPPANLTCEEGKAFVKLTWGEVAGVTKYCIYRKVTTNKDDSDEVFEEIASTKKLTYKDKAVEKGNLYEYYVVSVGVDETKVSSPSNVAHCFLEPDSFLVSSMVTKKNKIKLTWKEVPAARKYIIYRDNSKGKYIKFKETDKKSFTDDSVRNGKTYKYKVVYRVPVLDGTFIEKESKVLKVAASKIDPDKKMVALTFDDGPGKYTQEIVDCLKKNDARATFYVLGCNVNSYRKAVKNAYNIGCEIGNHSYDHTILTKLSAKEVSKQMSDTDAKIKKITGKKSVTMRCPGGGVDKTVQGAVGKPIILWSIDTLDWKTRNTDKTISAVMNNVKDGDIVLMHDIHEPTKRAALYLIPKLKKKGYQLVTVSELAKYRGHKLSKGTIYHSLRKKK